MTVFILLAVGSDYTLIVRSFMTPSIAALLGRSFWWLQQTKTPASQRRLEAVLGGRAPSQNSL